MFEVGKLYYTTNKDGWSLFGEAILGIRGFKRYLKQNEVFLVLEKNQEDEYKILLNNKVFYLVVINEFNNLFSLVA